MAASRKGIIAVEIAASMSRPAHGVLLPDNAGWHKAKKLKWPGNLSPLYILPGCPELNPHENIWQYLRQPYLSNRVFSSYEAILDAACDAWNKLLAEAGRINSIATRAWAVIGQ